MNACRAILAGSYGISVVLDPPPDRSDQEYADAAVFFSAPHNKVVLSEKTVA